MNRAKTPCPSCQKATGCTCRRRKADQRMSSAARGYDLKWRRLRESFLAAHPLCEDCLANSRTEAATQVHHVVKIADNPQLRLDANNLMALCASCHARRTAHNE